jgi:hypothetical protein
VTLGAGEPLAASGTADQLGLVGDGCRRGEALITQVVVGVEGPFREVELGEQYVGDGVDDGLGRAF